MLSKGTMMHYKIAVNIYIIASLSAIKNRA